MTLIFREIDDCRTWTTLIAGVRHSNLLQSWAWGAAKAEVEGWIPRRLVIAAGDTALAAVQILERRYGPARPARLNRGPLWLDGDPTAETRCAVMAALRRRWRWWRLAPLLVAPEWPAVDGDTLAALGFRHRAGTPWRSAWLDLERPEADLRKNLNGKWRNMLVNAEKAPLTVEIVSGMEGIRRLMPLYRGMMAEKGFTGVSPSLIEAFARHGGEDGVLTLFADTADEPASAVLMARHGRAATYLVGWNGEAGRRHRGNHLLLWRALLALRERGCQALDLGGIDDVLTPGVASFKRGLGGSEYLLAGEWLSV
ncbi:MAG: GNAT family N-acetyltransferase [Magnetospirillum sp.]|nr:GNAT family N-acetyltransferase [Magnetospirillum sp.]